MGGGGNGRGSGLLGITLINCIPQTEQHSLFRLMLQHLTIRLCKVDSLFHISTCFHLRSAVSTIIITFQTMTCPLSMAVVRLIFWMCIASFPGPHPASCHLQFDKATGSWALGPGNKARMCIHLLVMNNDCLLTWKSGMMQNKNCTVHPRLSEHLRSW